MAELRFRFKESEACSFQVAVEPYGPTPLLTVYPFALVPFSVDNSETLGLGSGPAVPLEPGLVPVEFPDDVDVDGISSPPERRWPAGEGTCSVLHDSDGDGIDDGDEDTNGNGQRDPGETYARRADSDGDGLEDGIELRLLLSDPLDPASPGPYTDADGDGLPKSLDPNDAAPDTDGDLRLDGYEAATLGLGAVTAPGVHPPLGDVNDDGSPASVPHLQFIDPLITLAFFLDNIGLNFFPTVEGGRPGIVRGELNRDGVVSNADSMMMRSFIVQQVPIPHMLHRIADVDTDNILDASECANLVCGDTGSNRWLSDTDGDGRRDWQEDTNLNGLRDPGETDPRLADTDGDGFEDGIEAVLGTDPLVFDEGFVDADGDALPDSLDPDDTDPDIDNDRVDDGYETAWYGDVDAASDARRVPPLGDANGDAVTTNLDALLTQALFLGLVGPEHAAFDQGPRHNNGFRHTDVDRNGQITNLDALVIHSWFLKGRGTLPLR